MGVCWTLSTCVRHLGTTKTIALYPKTCTAASYKLFVLSCNCDIRSALKEEHPHPGESRQPAVYVFVISELIRQTFALAFQDIHIPEAAGTSFTYPHLILLAALGNSMHTAAASMFWSVMVQTHTPTPLSGTSPASVFIIPQIP